MGGNFLQASGVHLFQGAATAGLDLGQDTGPATLAGERGHGHARKSAGIDPGKGFEVVHHVQGQAVEGHPVAHGHTDAAKLAAGGPDAAVARVVARDHASVSGGAQHHLLHEGHMVTHREPGRAQMDDRVDHQLARVVAGDLAAPFDPCEFRAALLQHGLA
jgi:hypothetical protein